jgi:hypothetical protein
LAISLRWRYLPFAGKHQPLQKLPEDAIQRQTRCPLIDTLGSSSAV